MFRCSKCTSTSGRRLTDVRAQVGEAAAQAKEIIVPIALDAKDRLLPLALDAKDRLVPLAEAAIDKAFPLALDAKDRLVPLAEAAVDKARPIALDAKEHLIPLAEAAVDKARPVVEQARGKVTDAIEVDVLPRLVEFRDQPLFEHAPLAVLPIQDEEPAAKSKKRRHPILRVLGLAILGAAAWLIIKTLLGSRDDGWELQEADIDGAEPAPGEIPFAETTLTEAEPVQTDAEPVQAEAEPVEYGEGSYRGGNPPEDFIIKGNERSMKYHVPKAIGYERTVTDLWFNSPEAAERAGFTRALR